MCSRLSPPSQPLAQVFLHLRQMWGQGLQTWRVFPEEPDFTHRFLLGPTLSLSLYTSPALPPRPPRQPGICRTPFLSKQPGKKNKYHSSLFPVLQIPSTTPGFLLIALHRKPAAREPASTEESAVLEGFRWSEIICLDSCLCLGLQRDVPGAGRVSPEDGDELLSLTTAVIVGAIPVLCRCPGTVPNPS